MSNERDSMRRPIYRLVEQETFNDNVSFWKRLGKSSLYDPSAYHKKNPELWGLPRVNPPRPYGTYCDILTCIRKYGDASKELINMINELMQETFTRGTFSSSIEKGWPTCLWAVTEDQEIVEAHRGTRGSGKYHGYPYRGPAKFAEEIVKRWSENE